MSQPRHHILLELEFSGVTYRISDATFEVGNVDLNNTLSFESGFDDVAMQQAMTFLASAPAALTVPVQCVLPVDVAAQYALGWQLARSPARLSVWLEGTDYSQRLQLIDGIVTGPTWRFLGDPVSFSIELPESVREVVYPPVSQQVSSDTVGEFTALSLSLDELGLTYPTVFGSPGKTGDTTWVPATQALWYAHYGQGTAGAGLPRDNTLRLVLAGHHVTGTFVTLTGDADLSPNGHRFPVANTYDLLGQPVAVVYEHANIRDYGWEDWFGNRSAPDNFFIDGNPENGGYWYGLGHQITPGNPNDFDPNLDPGLYQPITVVAPYDTPKNPSATPPERPTTSSVFCAWREYHSSTWEGNGIVGLSPLAGDVIEYMLKRAGLTIDYARMASTAVALQAYRFDCAIDDPVKPLEWLEANILPFLPASVVRGNEGWYAIFWRKDATAADATATLDVTTDSSIRLLGDVSFDSDVINQASLQYQYDVQHSRYTATIWRGGYPNDQPASATAALNGESTYDPSQDAYTRISQAAFGVQPRAYMAPCIYDSATAGRVLADRIRAFGQPRMRAVYTVPRSYNLELGQVVTLTDPQLSLYARVALVEQIEIDSTGLDAVRLLFIADPLRDTVGA